MVTFTSGAELLVQQGIARSMTREGLRKIAKTHPEWPFGEGRAHPYYPMGRAQAMETGPFLSFFRDLWRDKGRGPDLHPRRRGSGSANPEGGG